MKTRLLSFDQVEVAAELLMQGEVVAMPTDTVYGVGVNPFDAAAIDALYEVKERPAEKGIPVLLSDKSQLERVSTVRPTPRLQRLIDRFWPGALTLIVPKKWELPDNISSNDGIAVRVPDHVETQRLISLAGGALAVSSANLSGQPPATSAEMVSASLDGRISAILDGGTLPGALPSTIIDCRTEDFKILRQGPLSAETLFEDDHAWAD